MITYLVMESLVINFDSHIDDVMICTIGERYYHIIRQTVPKAA
jgi:hypothetical protein